MRKENEKRKGKSNKVKSIVHNSDTAVHLFLPTENSKNVKESTSCYQQIQTETLCSSRV